MPAPTMGPLPEDAGHRQRSDASTCTEEPLGLLIHRWPKTDDDSGIPGTIEDHLYCPITECPDLRASAVCVDGSLMAAELPRPAGLCVFSLRCLITQGGATDL